MFTCCVNLFSKIKLAILPLAALEWFAITFNFPLESSKKVQLIILSKLEKSKSEIRRLLKGNAVKINDNVISDEKFEINKNLFKDNYLKLSLGKKRHIKIELN